MDKRDLVAFAVFCVDYTDGDAPDIESAPYYLGRWNEIWRPALQQEHWGDCVNVPMTCSRCLVEGWYRSADVILAVADGPQSLSAKIRMETR